MPLQIRVRVSCLVLVLVTGASFSHSQNTPSNSGPDGQSQGLSASEERPRPQPASLNGTVVDQSGAAVVGASITISRENENLSPDAQSGTDGEFFFPNVSPGSFQLTVRAAGFATQTRAGTVNSGEVQTVPQVVLEIASALTEVKVGVSTEEVATEQIKLEEQQRILGIVPNFYVSYIPNAAPLTSKQKFKLAARSSIDPFTFFAAAAAAGVEQAQNHFYQYGQGAEGYAKRFGANYADDVTSTFIGGAVFPSLLKQDPRYFYKGTGSKESRAMYAIAMSVILKGDNGHWQFGYSTILGALAAGGISNLYYPSEDRNSAQLTFENAAVALASNAVTNLLQEFVIRKFTPKLPARVPNNP